MDSAILITAISNPNSGLNKRGQFQRFCDVVAAYPQVQHEVTRAESDMDGVLEACQSAAVPVIIINGGDGTLHKVLSFLSRSAAQGYAPKLAVVRAGTTNMTFGDIGFNAGLNELFNDLLAYVSGEKNKVKECSRPILRMRIPAENREVCGMFFGAGAVYSGILYCRQNIHSRGIAGELGPTLAVLRYLLDWVTRGKLIQSAMAEVHHGQQLIAKDEFSVILASTLERLIGGIYPFWGKAQSENELALTLIKVNSKKSVLASLRILWGRAPRVNDQGYISLKLATVRLMIAGGFTLDGELFGGEDKTSEVWLDANTTAYFLTR
ncbi:MAG: diacylglycerol kinase family protein [Gammaproteobacteria bacterium]|nr:diacylglycerol kinase family protein [Gammaproteobacteria bacterium]